MKKITAKISAAISKVDNWSPTTCPMTELRSHVEDLEQIEALLVTLTNRAAYLRGVLAARTVSEIR